MSRRDAAGDGDDVVHGAGGHLRVERQRQVPLLRLGPAQRASGPVPDAVEGRLEVVERGPRRTDREEEPHACARGSAAAAVEPPAASRVMAAGATSGSGSRPATMSIAPVNSASIRRCTRRERWVTRDTTTPTTKAATKPGSSSYRPNHSHVSALASDHTQATAAPVTMAAIAPTR